MVKTDVQTTYSNAGWINDVTKVPQELYLCLGEGEKRKTRVI